jgi:hypothetical protein
MSMGEGFHVAQSGRRADLPVVFVGGERERERERARMLLRMMPHNRDSHLGARQRLLLPRSSDNNTRSEEIIQVEKQ